jgi:photosystem II stability/assembly factor-like uncharacterized protein
MARIYFSFLLFVITTSGLYAQDWEFIGGPGGEQIRGLAISPNGILYVFSNGVFRSTDKGISWRRSGIELPISDADYPPKLEFHKDGTLYLVLNKGLWKSVDEGLTWIRIKSIDARYLGVEVTPQGTIILLDRDSVAISTDSGISWRNVYVTSDDVQGLYVDSLGTIFTGGRSVSYRSTDQGQNWSKLLNGFPQSRSLEDMEFAPNGNALALTDNGIYVSTDHGLSWKQSGDDIHLYEFAIGGDDLLFGMNSSGDILRSVNMGSSWTQISNNTKSFNYEDENMAYYDGSIYYFTAFELSSRTVEYNEAKTINIPNARIDNFIVAPSSTIFASTKNTSVWSYVNSTWSQIPGFGVVTAIAVDSANVLYGIGSSKFYTSTDGGQTAKSLSSVGSGIVGLAVGKDGEVLAVSPIDGFFRSTDGGNIWMQLNAGMPDKALSSVAIGAYDVFFAGGNKRYYRSTDEGLSWSEPIFPFITGSGTVRSITTLGERVVFGIDRTGVYFSSDNGVMWENHSTGLALDTVYDITITSKGDVVCAASSGVYLYSAESQAWKEIGPSAVRRSIRTIAEGKDGKLYVGSDGNGVYRTVQAFSDVVSQPETSSGITMYPNPASTEVTISFKSGRPEKYRTAIYNLLGESILRGSDEETINVSSLGSGQYFLRVITDGKIQTLPLSVIR